MLKQTFSFLFLLMMGSCCMAQHKFSLVDSWLHNNLYEIGGRGVIMVWKDGRIVHSHAENNLNMREKVVIKWAAKKQGRDVEEELQDFTTGTPKPIASCSKWLSAAVIMTFVQEGKLGLDDTIGKYLSIMTQNGKGSVRIKDCLSHLTGIKAPPLKEALTEQKEFNTMDDAMQNIAALPMEGEPGKSFHYNNVGLQMTAAIVEKISGQRFETLFQQRIAQPCGMVHTTFGNKPVALPAGGAVGSAEDYLQFLSMILNDGKYNGKQVLSK